MIFTADSSAQLLNNLKVCFRAATDVTDLFQVTVVRIKT